MKVLLGVINSLDSESLFIFEKGQSSIIPATEEEIKNYPNYNLLKQKKLKINDEKITGPGVFQFRYGPVTAGVREAGSFDLYTYGEKILRASINISWKHRGIEKAMVSKSPEDALALSEQVCSNFAISHSLAFSRAVENAISLPVSIITRNWRILLLEAERIYNHLYVIYRLTSAAAQKVLAVHLLALFEEALRLNEVLTGSRYLMGINNIGKFNHLPDFSNILIAAKGYEKISTRFRRLYEHSLANTNYLDRLHSAGTLTPAKATSLGLTGPSLRACGLDDYLNGNLEHLIILPVVTQNEGDSLARMEVRAEEIVNSLQYLISHLKVSDSWSEEMSNTIHESNTNGTGYAVANSPSGAVGYYVVIEDKKIKQVNICTPSYVGMHAMSMALEEMVFTDFPFVCDSFGVYFTGAAV
jgi:Ni,Fe-hydrogenase III large subunit